jgi:tetratricopeptide (TPR) repeat protein
MKTSAMIMKWAAGAATATLLVSGGIGRAEELRPPATPALRGADAILRELAAAKSSPAPRDDGMAEVVAFVSSARDLRARQAALGPRQAAEQWLALWDRCLQLSSPNNEPGSIDRGQLWRVVLFTLPRPDAWPEIDRLLQDRATEKAKNGPPRPDLLPSAPYGLPSTSDAFLIVQRIFALVIQEKFDEAIALARGLDENLAAQVSRMREAVSPPPFRLRLEAALAKKGDSYGWLDVPDLLPLFGADQTREFAQQILLSDKITRLSLNSSGTLAVFREEALKLLSKLPHAPWSLCAAPGGEPLHQALIGRFGDPLAPSSGQTKTESAQESLVEAIAATQWRAVEALRDQRKTDAIRWLAAIASRPPSFEQLRSNGVEPDFAFDTLSEVAQQTRSPALVPILLELAPSAGPADRVLSVIRRTWTGEAPEYKFPLARLEITLHLAHGEIEPAIAALRAALQAARKSAVTAGGAVSAESTLQNALAELSEAGVPASPDGFWVQGAAQMVSLGIALGRGELVDEGRAEIESALETLPRSRRSDEALSYHPAQVADELLAANRLAAAEHLCALLLGRATGPEFRSRQNSVLATLVRIYERAGRPADALQVLTDAPQWEETDLSQVREPGLWMAAARALAATGRKEPALKIIREWLKLASGDDEAYALLVDLDGDGALPQLDRLAAADRWQERPLIWKAELLRRLGRLGEAEAAARAALAIDPTDGEEVAGARVRGYAVLAEILAAAGKKDDATFFNHVVTSVRIAEAGDALRTAGLLDAARQKYEEAQALFADAYCIQWRLADSLQRQGHTAEATKHYETAFARMPEQFGRMATLCFGCENVFGNEPSRSAAERVLSALAAAPHPRPQVFLILARLRLQQERPADAWQALQQAVSLDPDYLDAWVELSRLLRAVDPSHDQRRAIGQRLRELDPTLRHGYFDESGMLSPKSLWELMQRSLEDPLPATELFALPEAAQALQPTDRGKSEQERQRRLAVFGEFSQENTEAPSGRLFHSWVGPLGFGGYY